MLTGIISIADLEADLPGYADVYAQYQSNQTAVAALKLVTTSTKITVIIGTWCSDCYRETPRFIRLIAEIANPNFQVTYIGVDRSKQDPEGASAQFSFSRIPTFIVEQNGVEVGRIVEEPQSSLEADLAAML